jgi:DNA-binding transcriptional MerR regulator
VVSRVEPTAHRLAIGQVARLAGLTTKALRHYDRIGLLRPAVVDPATGYRRYEPGLVAQARLSRGGRLLSLPVDVGRRLLDLAGDPPAGNPPAGNQDAFRAALARHRRRVEARVTRLQRILHTLGHAITDDDWMTVTDTDAPTPADDKDLHRHWGKTLFNDTWRLMEKEDRTPDEDAQMIHQAHASAYHWLQAGGPEHFARSHWQCSRVYCVLGRGEPALYHARFVLDLCQRHGIGDWDLAFAYEALARAHAVAGDKDEARRWLELARLASADIAEDDDRELLLSDLETISA